MTRRRISAKERLEIFQRAKGRCHICGFKIDAGRERWDVEHVLPLNMGGTEGRDDENLQPAHRSCHAEKSRDDARNDAKAKRMQQRNAGIRRQPKRKIPSRPFSPFRRGLDDKMTPK